MSPNPLQLAKDSIKSYALLSSIKNAEIWLIFDDDNRQNEVKQAIELIENSGKNINIAFMKPCFEIWPLMHLNKDRDVINQEQAQRKLESLISSYKHDRYPYIKIKYIENGYEIAVKKAKSWHTSLDGACVYTAPRFAGIYKLTEIIKNA